MYKADYKPLNATFAAAKRLFVLLALLLGGACAFTPERPLESYPGYSQASLPGSDIRVLSWNIRKGLANNWQAGVASGQLANSFAQFDLILLQEACAKYPEQLQDLGDTLAANGFGWHFATSFVSAVWGCGNGNTNGVLIAARAAPIDALALRSEGSEFLITQKASLALLFQVAGVPEPLLAINTHLLNFEMLSNADFTAQLQALSDLVETHVGPVLLAGDFNTRNEERTLALEAVMQQNCLQALLPRHPDPRTTDRLHARYVLDHMLYRGLSPLAPLNVGDEVAAGLSDHNSLAASFSVSPYARCAYSAPPL